MTDRLIIVRADDNSCHHQWGDGNWDIINSYYGENPPSEAIHIKGGKWDGIYETFLKKPELLEKYKTIWLPDDDIETNASDIETMFKIHQQYGLELSQPALSYDSYVLHSTLLQVPKFILRYSTFVEIMMPCFSVGLLKKALPFFKENKTGRYLDFVWHRFCDEPFEKAAILDIVAMRHSRPVGISKGPIINETNSEKDGLKLMKSFSEIPDYLIDKLPRPFFYAGILKSSKKIIGVKKTGTKVFLSFLTQIFKISKMANIGSGVGHRSALFMLSRFFRHVILHHFFYMPNLERVDLNDR